MKKIFAILLSFALLFTVCACSDGSQTATEAATEAATESAETAASQEGEAAGTTDIDAVNAIVDALTLVEPEVLGTVSKLGQYTGLALTAVPHVEITMEEADDYIATYILPNFTEEVTDAIQDGDTANIDFEGKKDGVAFDGGTSEGYDLEIGSGSFIDGFESGLVGHKAGETVDLALTFPEDYGSEELAGQDVIFTVKINTVTRQAELTDEIAAQVNDTCKTVEDLRKLALDTLQAEQDLTEQQELYLSALEQVIGDSEVVPDDAAVEYMTNQYVLSYAESMKTYGLDLGTLLSYYGSSYEEFRDSYNELSIDNIKQRTVLEEIAKKENLVATEEAIAAFAENYGYTTESIKEVLSEKLLNQLVVEDLANQFIIDNSTVTEGEAAAE